MALLQMNKIKFFFEKTKSSIKYLGTVAVIISLSVMFSSLCVMSLLSLANTLKDSLDENPRATVGGDMTITPLDQNEENFNIVKNKLEEMKKEGKIKEFTYTSVSYNYTSYNFGSGISQYVTLVGYEDSRFPLKDVKHVLTPDISFDELEKVKDGAFLPKNLVEAEHLKVGDTFLIYSSDMYDIHQLKLIGVVDFTPHSAHNIYVNKDFIEGEKAYTFYADIVGDDYGKVKTEIASAFPKGSEYTIGTWDVKQLAKENDESSEKISTLIKGLSVLGLFVGSFGIASAVNTIIIKRRKEIGIMKSIGFTKGDISIMLLSEVALISVIGSVVGVLLGFIFFRYLVGIISTGEMAVLGLNKDFNWTAVGLSLLVSIISSIIFAYISISNVAELKPTYALKDYNIEQKESKKGKAVLRFIIVGLLFCGISIFLTKSFLYGVGAVALVSIALLLFSLLFRFIFFLILKIPVRSHNFVEFAWDSLRQSYKRIIFAMVAIFIGMFTVNFIMLMMDTASGEYKNRYKEVEADTNVVVTSLVDGDMDDSKILEMKEVENGFVMYKAKLDKRSGILSEIIGVNLEELGDRLKIVEGDMSGMIALEVGNNEEYMVEGNIGTVTETEDGKIMSFEDMGWYRIGDIVTLVINGEETQIPVSGLYKMPEYKGGSIKYLPSGGFISKEKFNSLRIDKYVKEFWLNVKDENYKSFYAQVSKLPNTFIESSFRIEEEMNLILDMMVRFSVSVASLALLAGVILIIIVTVLDVTSRGRDFAIYKTLGFVQKEVVWMVLLEYGVMTVITSAFASLMSFVACEVINRYDEELFGFTINQKLNFNFGRSMLLNVIIIGLVLLLVHLVSKKPLKVKPTEVLRYE